METSPICSISGHSSLVLPSATEALRSFPESRVRTKPASELRALDSRLEASGLAPIRRQLWATGSHLGLHLDVLLALA